MGGVGCSPAAYHYPRNRRADRENGGRPDRADRHPHLRGDRQRSHPRGRGGWYRLPVGNQRNRRTLRITADAALPEIFPLTVAGAHGRGEPVELAVPPALAQ